MAAFNIRLASFALFSLCVVGCEAPDSPSTEGEENGESSTTESSAASTQSEQEESSSVGSTGGTELTMDASSSLSTSTTTTSSTPPDSSDESSSPSTTSSSSSSESSGSEAEQPFKLRLKVPDHKVLLGDATGQLRLEISLMNQPAGSTALLDQAVDITASGLIELELPEPTAGADANKLQQFMVTLYQDVEDNRRTDEQDDFSATLLEFLVYKKSNPAESRWRKFDPESKKALLIEDAISMVRVSGRSERKSARLGGKVENADKAIRAVALLSEGEKMDLKRNFIFGHRALDQEIARDKIFWEGELSGGMNRNRWADEKRPVLAGFGRHGISWFSGYNTPPPSLIPGLRRNSKVTDELCHKGQPLAAIWIEPSRSWVRTPRAAFLVAYHDLAPGWNIIKLERGGSKKLSFHSIPESQRQELEFSPVCGKVSLPVSGVEIAPSEPIVSP